MADASTGATTPLTASHPGHPSSPSHPSTAARAATLRALLRENAQLTEALRIRLKAVEAALEDAETTRLAIANATAARQDFSAARMYRLPARAPAALGTEPWLKIGNPWRARGLVHASIYPRGWTMGAVPPTEEDQRAAALSLLLLSPPTVAKPAQATVSSTTITSQQDSPRPCNKQQSQRVCSSGQPRKRPRGSKGEGSLAEAEGRGPSGTQDKGRHAGETPAANRVSNSVAVQSAYASLPSLRGIVFPQLKYRVVSIAGEPSMTRRELQRLLSEVIAVPGQQGFHAYWASPHRMYYTALTQLAELGVARSTGTNRAEVLRRLLRVCYHTTTYALLSQSFCFRGAAACTEADIMRTDGVQMMRRIQRRRSRHTIASPGDLEDASRLRERVAVALVRAASLETVFTSFCSPLQAIAFAFVGMVPEDVMRELDPIRAVDASLILEWSSAATSCALPARLS